MYRPAVTGDRDADKVTEVETPANGIIEFTGLKAGTYYLKETFAPKGYNKLSDPVEVTIRGYELSLRKDDAQMVEVS